MSTALTHAQDVGPIREDRPGFEDKPMDDIGPYKEGTLQAVLDNGEAVNVSERQTAMELAMQIDPGPSIRSWRGIKFWLICVLIFMSPGDWGFDGTIIASINSMEQYRDFFALKSEATTKTGVIFGIGAAATFVTVIPSYYVPDKLGRRWAMFLGNIIPIIGAILCGVAKDYNWLVAARAISSLGFAGAAPYSYLAEIAHPKQRGFIIGFFNSCYYIGQILATGICIPFGRGSSDWAWRIPFMLQAVPLIILLAFVLFIPESPRWLYAHGHHEQAVKVLAELHSRDGHIHSPLVQLEIQDIAAHIDQSGSDKRIWDFRPLFNTRANTYRFLLGVVNLVWSSLAGNGLITHWFPVLVNQAGFTNTDRQRVLTFANSLTSFAGAMIGVNIVDRVGRRFLMLWAAGSCGVGMAICAAVLSPAGHQSTQRAEAGVACLMLFMVCFSIGWTPLQNLYPTEVLSYENRQKGNALRVLIGIVVGCFNSFALPVLLERIAWKNVFSAYLIFVAFDVTGFILIYLFAVETKQLSLEDLDEVFASSNPKRTSLKLVKDARRKAKAEASQLGRGLV